MAEHTRAGVAASDSYVEVGRIDHERHEVRLLSAGRHGSWAECSCGWTSVPFFGIAGAQYDWACHVRDEAQKEVERAHDQTLTSGRYGGESDECGNDAR